MDRRHFLKAGLASGLSMAALADLFAAQYPNIKQESYGVQLYTFRKQIYLDPRKVLNALPGIGISFFESYTTNQGLTLGMEMAEFRKLQERNKLQYLSAHVPFVSKDEFNLFSGTQKVLAQAKELDIKYIVVPYLEAEYYQAPEMANKTVTMLSEVRKKVEDAGFQFAYHNHAFEFDTFYPNNKTFFDVLKETDPDLKFEIDLYWVFNATTKFDVPTFIYDLRERISLLHVKDSKATTTGKAKSTTVEVGAGDMDYARIFTAKRDIGLDCPWFIEQDESADPMKSVATSVQNLKTLITE